jgi:hypothetical protein
MHGAVTDTTPVQSERQLTVHGKHAPCQRMRQAADMAVHSGTAAPAEADDIQQGRCCSSQHGHLS